MSFRCINAFAFGDAVYGNGFQVEDDDPILKTHADHFAEVEHGFTGRAVEQAEAKPGGLRATTPKKQPAKKAPAAPTPKPPAEPSAKSEESK
jgi:hypothetical protein